MLRIKALFRARAIPTPGVSVYRAAQRKEWLTSSTEVLACGRRPCSTQLDMLLKLRPKAKAAMIAEARRQPGWKILRSIPFLGPVRTGPDLAIMGTPFRFRTKRNLWPYAGLAVVTRSSADQEFKDGKLQRSKKAPLTRGLNRNHNPMLKSVFKGAATAAAVQARSATRLLRSVARPRRERRSGQGHAGAQDRRGALRLWKKGELWDPKKLTMQAT